MMAPMPAGTGRSISPAPNNVVNGDSVTLSSLGGIYDSAMRARDGVGPDRPRSTMPLYLGTLRGPGRAHWQDRDRHADAKSRLVGDPNPPLIMRSADSAWSTATTLTGGLATAATTQSDAGSYAITQATLAPAAITR